jgi:hypothetical protein
MAQSSKFLLKRAAGRLAAEKNRVAGRLVAVDFTAGLTIANQEFVLFSLGGLTLSFLREGRVRMITLIYDL